jgi:hypothetical protein
VLVPPLTALRSLTTGEPIKIKRRLQRRERNENGFGRPLSEKHSPIGMPEVTVGAWESTGLVARSVFKTAEVFARGLVGSIPTLSRQVSGAVKSSSIDS